ncbi:MAG: hypothetical protein ACXABJ_03855, partial [Candidatus Heimdallarchaeaceae archaeon]
MNDPHWIKAYERWALIYDEITEIDLEIKRKKEDRTRKEIEAITQIMKKRELEIEQSVLLDIGGGTGRLAIPLSKQVKNLILAEPSKPMLDIAKSKFKEIK